MLRFCCVFLLLIASGPCLAQINSLESGIAITDPAVLTHLEQEGYSIGALLLPRAPNARVMKNDALLTGPLTSVLQVLTADIKNLPQQSRDADARRVFADPDSNRLRFSAELLNDRKAGFVLVGIVNRMDRAFRIVDGVSKYDLCGEMRFLYRFTYDVMVNGHEVSSRLPFTLSVVLNARNKGDPITCSEIARRWQRAGTMSSMMELMAFLDAADGPLKYLKPSQVDRLEVNLQLFRLPASEKPHFGGYAEYLLRVFRRDRPGAPFAVMRMENEIDHERLRSDSGLLQSFKTWLFKPDQIADLDRGLLDIPWKYLSVRGLSVSPGGASRSGNLPFSDLFTDEEISAALAKYTSTRKLNAIRSVEGFKRRLNDLACSGCHQVRAIAGFHFPGADPADEPPSNAVHVPASAHFFADIPRRAAVVEAFASGLRPDFAKSYSARPDQKFAQSLATTQLFDGWGAPCYTGTDPSFTGWTCRSSLQCKTLHQSPLSTGMGTCVTASRVQIGDPMEFGEVLPG